MANNDGFYSATETIMEYSIKAPEGEGASKSKPNEMVIVDTPGFGDTRGKEFIRDSQFMATLESYLDGHPELSKVFPTAVLLVVKFDDERIQAENSRFVQMLKGLKTLISNGKLIDTDEKSCNLVIILTHAMSEQDVGLQEDPTPRIRLIQSLLKSTANISTANFIVMAENKPHLYKIPQNAEYCELPNGDYYPYNLYEAWQSIATECEDIVGEDIIQTIFKNSKVLTSLLKKNIDLVPEISPHALKFYNQLIRGKFYLPDSEIAELLMDAWRKLDEGQRKPYENSVFIASNVFQTHNIKTKEDLPKTKSETIKLLSEIPLNPALEQVLRQLGVAPPLFETSQVGVGCYYNVAFDSASTESPVDASNAKLSSIGFAIPSFVEAKSCDDPGVIIVEGHSSLGVYRKARLCQLGIYSDFPKGVKRAAGTIRAGHTVHDSNVEEGISGMVEFRKYHLTLAKNCKLSKSYLRKFSQLPDDYSSKDKERWQQFFMETGTYLITSAYTGGSMEVVATRSKSQDYMTSAATIQETIKLILKKAGEQPYVNPKWRYPDWSLQLRFSGGDQNLVRPTELDQLFSDTGVEFWKNWVSSLPVHPVLLPSSFEVKSVISFIKNEDTSALSLAISEFTGSVDVNTGYMPAKPSRCKIS